MQTSDAVPQTNPPLIPHTTCFNLFQTMRRPAATLSRSRTFGRATATTRYSGNYPASLRRLSASTLLLRHVPRGPRTHMHPTRPPPGELVRVRVVRAAAESLAHVRLPPIPLPPGDSKRAPRPRPAPPVHPRGPCSGPAAANDPHTRRGGPHGPRHAGLCPVSTCPCPFPRTDVRPLPPACGVLYPPPGAGRGVVPPSRCRSGAWATPPPLLLLVYLPNFIRRGPTYPEIPRTFGRATATTRYSGNYPARDPASLRRLRASPPPPRLSPLGTREKRDLGLFLFDPANSVRKGTLPHSPDSPC